MHQIYLASQSPRRRQLLEQIGISPLLLLPDATDESPEDLEALEIPLPAEEPKIYVQRVTLAKLNAARRRAERRDANLAPILCADTTVALGSQILGKPDDAQHATSMLEQLSGKAHLVYTAVAIFWRGQTATAISESSVQFAKLSTTQIQSYIDSKEWDGKAGGYGIQGLAASFIKNINGSYSGIMGLPLFETAQLLEQLAPYAEH